MPTYISRNFRRCVVMLGLLTVNLFIPQTLAASETEADLLTLLRSDAPAAEKALACKKLAIYGSETAVPDLATLLPNPQLSSWSRIALEAIPGDASDEALRNAAASLEGRLLVGVINSISFRRDSQAVSLLVEKLNDPDTEVASAAAVALGSIGNPDATRALRMALDGSSAARVPALVRSAIAEGCVLSAERLHAAGDSAAATEIYDEVRRSEVPTQRIIEATRGAILARNQAGIPLLMETFRSADKKMFQLALGTAREFPGDQVDKALAAELIRTEPHRAALMVQAMADRPNTVSLPVVLKAAESGDKQVRLSALNALQRIGDDSCLSALLRISADADADLAAAAKQTVAVLPGAHVNGEIRERLVDARGKERLTLLKIVGDRRIDAVDEVAKSLSSTDKAMRRAALAALGETVSLTQMPVLVSQTLRPQHAEDAAAAMQALKAASVRMPDRESCSAQLATALSRATSDKKIAILEVIAEVGGTHALETLATAAKSKEPELQDAGSRLLGTWNSVAAAPVLLDLATTGPAEKYRVRALRGYLGLARKFSMSDAERAKMCQDAFDATRRVSEHKLALNVLKLHPSPEGLAIAVKAMKVPDLKEEATAAAMTIARKIGKGNDVRKLMSGAGLQKVDVEILQAKYGAGEQVRDVTGVLRKQTKDLPLITLKSSQYNASFGGDPAPGVPKQLQVSYRINGKSGEASFTENALILLPIPQ